MTGLPLASALAARLTELPWVSELWVAGSLATGDYVPGVSDLDLVAVTDGAVTEDRTARLVAIHRELDAGAASGADLGCVYVDAGRARGRHALATGTLLSKSEAVQQADAPAWPGRLARCPPDRHRGPARLTLRTRLEAGQESRSADPRGKPSLVISRHDAESHLEERDRR